MANRSPEVLRNKKFNVKSQKSIATPHTQSNKIGMITDKRVVRHEIKRILRVSNEVMM